MVNASIDYLKHQKRLHEVPMEHASMVAVSDDDLDDEGEFSFETVKASGIGCEQLMDMLNSLPEANRVVFNLYAVEDMKHKTIAELLGITEEASRARLKRARMQLRDQLEQKMKLKRKVAHV
jgi:RNA polymerase sigma-70 factor (ECF subfamily)